MAASTRSAQDTAEEAGARLGDGEGGRLAVVGDGLVEGGGPAVAERAPPHPAASSATTAKIAARRGRTRQS
jgi:hypothetical protein